MQVITQVTMDWLQNPAVLIGVLALVAFALLTLVYLLIHHVVPWLRKRNGYWHEDEIEEALLPLIDQVIVALFNLSEHSMELIGRVLESADKELLARESYRLVLGYLDGLGIPIDLFQRIVTPELWASWVETRYNELIVLYREASGKLLDLLRP